jgi:hypothetical protein
MGTPEAQDPYSVLGVPRTATAAEIRAAYHALVAKYHPDRHQGNPLASLASEKMIELNRAYEALSDPARQRFVDEAAAPPPPAAAAARRTSWWNGRPRTTSKATPRPGAPPWGTGAYRATASATAPRPKVPVRRNYGRLVVLLALLPVIARFGALIVRGVMNVVRSLVEGLTLLRGTPVGAAIALVATLFLAFFLVRRLRRASAANRDKPPA